MDSDKWLAAEEVEMAFFFNKKMIAYTSNNLSKGVIGITTMPIYPLKWTFMNNIERYKARWIISGCMEILHVHFNHDVTHEPVALDSS